MRVLLVDTFSPVLDEMLTAAGFECVDLRESSADEVRAKLPEAEGLVMRSKLSLDANTIDQATKLKFIGRVGAGLERIDVLHAEKKGVKVFSSPEGNRQSVAEHALGMLLALFNKIPQADRQVRAGIWDRKANNGNELSGKTVGIIGFGNTGSAFAQVLSGLGVEILAYDKYKSGFGSTLVDETTMQHLQAHCDVVSLHLPLTPETDQLVDEAWIDAFQKPITLINTSRGGIVKTDAVVKGLESGALCGACLDVLEYEAADLSFPKMVELPPAFHALIERADVVLSPHVAGITHESYEKLSAVLAEKIITHFAHA